MTDTLSQVFPCIFCGHRYRYPCATQERAEMCGNYQFMQTRGDVGRVHPVTQEPVESVEARIARLNAMLKGGTP